MAGMTAEGALPKAAIPGDGKTREGCFELDFFFQFLIFQTQKKTHLFQISAPKRIYECIVEKNRIE